MAWSPRAVTARAITRGSERRARRKAGTPPRAVMGLPSSARSELRVATPSRIEADNWTAELSTGSIIRDDDITGLQDHNRTAKLCRESDGGKWGTRRTLKTWQEIRECRRVESGNVEAWSVETWESGSVECGIQERGYVDRDPASSASLATSPGRIWQ